MSLIIWFDLAVKQGMTQWLEKKNPPTHVPARIFCDVPSSMSLLGESLLSAL